MGLYSGVFTPPSEGEYKFSADFEADTGCTVDNCAPSDFYASGSGRCLIQVERKVIKERISIVERR